MTESTILTIIPVEEQINQELIKANVTESIIANLKEKYLPLKISGIDDKETYLIVKEARKECKSLRVMAEKICKKGREEAVAIQKAWVAKEKEVTGQIGEVEDYLEKQEKEYDAAVEAEKLRRKREQEEQFILRQQTLSNMGVLYSDGNFSLGQVSFEMSLIKECDTDIWESDILPKFKDEYQKVEAERIETERIKQEREAEFKRQQEELERKQKELEEKETALKAAQEEQERKQREEEEKKAAEAQAKEKARNKARMDQLTSLGLKVGFEGDHMYFKGYDCWVSHLDITGHNDEEWDKMIEDITPFIANKKEEEEQKRIAEIEAQKEAERKKILGKTRFQGFVQLGYDHGKTADELSELSDDEYIKLSETAVKEWENKQREKIEKEQEEKKMLEDIKRQQEEQKRQEELAQAGDKDKWNDIIRQIDAMEIHEMRSGQYRKKAAILREKLEEIKAL
jgi:hypothetical protein